MLNRSHARISVASVCSVSPPENAGSIGYTALFEFMMIIP